MIEPNKIDPERLAALIDGRLGGAEASALRQQLALAGDDTLAAFADAVAVSRELETLVASPSEGRAPEVAYRTGRWRRSWLTPAFASVAAALVVFAVWPGRQPSQRYQPSSFADAIPAGAQLLDGFAWTTRGGTRQGEPSSDRARAVRVGALLTDLDLDAVRRAPAAHHAAALATLLEGTMTGGPVGAQWLALVSDTTSRLSRDTVAKLGQQSLAVVDQHRTLAIAGAYLEAARVATAAGDTTFFDHAPDAPLAELDGNAPVDSQIREAVGRLLTLIQTHPRDPTAIGDSVGDLLKTLAQ